MKVPLLFGCLMLTASLGDGRAAPADPEESVVSVYTTPAGRNHSTLDVYQQIAYNVATRITTPIYRFFGYAGNRTDESTGKRNWSNIEVFDDKVDGATTPDVKPLNSNALGAGRDVEELSEEAKKRAEKKPEKITLYSNYLFDNIVAAQNAPLERNDTLNEVSDKDDELSLDDVSLEDDQGQEPAKPRQGALGYLLQMVGSWIQLIYGALTGIFSSRANSR